MQSKKLLLINPPSGLYRRDDRCQSKVDDQTVRVIFPPIDLAYLAAIAQKEGWEAKISDYPSCGGTWDDYEKDLESFQPSAVLFNVTTATIEIDVKAGRIAKSFSPETTVVAKGDYLNEQWLDVLQSGNGIDICIHLEPEWTFRDILRGKPLEEIDGISYISGGTPARNPDRPFIENLDEIPLPARDLLDNSLYKSPETGRMITVVHANRGCPAKCIFCPVQKVAGSKIRIRSPQSIIEEIRQCVDEYGIVDFLFHGDTFTFDKQWVVELCTGIVEGKLEIHWGCNSRVDTVDEERLKWMKRAGCWVVAFGVESGDDEILRKMKKGITREKVINAIKVCKEAGIRTHTFFVIGLPWDTKQSLKKTFDFIKELDPDFFDINIAYPLPGTEFYTIAKKEGLLENADLSKSGYAQAAVRTYELSNQDLNNARKTMLLKLYLRPGYIVRTLKNAGTIPGLFNYIKAATRRLISLVK